MQKVIRLGIAAATALALAPAWADDSASEPHSDMSDTEQTQKLAQDDLTATQPSEQSIQQNAGAGSSEPERAQEVEDEFLQSIWTSP